MHVCMVVCVIAYGIDLFSFSWLQVCLNKFSSVQFSDSSFLQYTVYADIRQGSLDMGASNDSGVIEKVDFHCFRTLHLWNLRK